MKICSKFVVAGVFAIGSSTSPSTAATIRADFTAQVHVTNAGGVIDLPNSLAIGQMGSGYFIYDTGLPDTNPDPNYAEYGPTSFFRFEIGGYIFQQQTEEPDGRMVVVNDQITFGDTFTWSNLKILSSGPDDFTASYVAMELRQFESAGATVFENDLLPQSLIIEDFMSSPRWFSIAEGPGGKVINMNVTSITTQIIPEPSTSVFLAIFTGAMLVRRRITR